MEASSFKKLTWLPAHLHGTSLNLAADAHGPSGAFEDLHDGHAQGLVDVPVSCLEAVDGIRHTRALQNHDNQ